MLFIKMLCVVIVCYSFINSQVTFFFQWSIWHDKKAESFLSLKVHEMRHVLIQISAQQYTILCRSVFSRVPSTWYRSSPEWPELIIISQESHFRQRKVWIYGYFLKKSFCSENIENNNVTLSKGPPNKFFPPKLWVFHAWHKQVWYFQQPALVVNDWIIYFFFLDLKLIRLETYYQNGFS